MRSSSDLNLQGRAETFDGQKSGLLTVSMSFASISTCAKAVPKYLDSDMLHDTISTSRSLHHCTIPYAWQPGLIAPRYRAAYLTGWMPHSCDFPVAGGGGGWGGGRVCFVAGGDSAPKCRFCTIWIFPYLCRGAGAR